MLTRLYIDKGGSDSESVASSRGVRRGKKAEESVEGEELEDIEDEGSSEGEEEDEEMEEGEEEDEEMDEGEEKDMAAEDVD